MATVREFMDRDPVTIDPEASVEEVARLLGRQELPGVPVVDEDGRCVGIVTESDLVIPDEEGDLHMPHYLSLFGGTIFLDTPGALRRFEGRIQKAFASRVRDLMSADPRVVAPDADIREAGHAISESGHNRLPVVEDGRLVGVVTRSDVLRALTG